MKFITESMGIIENHENQLKPLKTMRFIEKSMKTIEKSMNIIETIEDNETIEKSIKIIKKSMKIIEEPLIFLGGEVWGTSPPLEK